MSLLDISAFEPVFLPLKEQHVGWVVLDGNVGDRLINKATKQLFRDFRIAHRTIEAEELKSGELRLPVDCIVVSGGGNMGGMYPVTVHQRQRALAFGLPVTVLPQSFTDLDEDVGPYHRVYVRERRSLAGVPGAELAPDLALGLRHPFVDEGVEARTGVWLREDDEGLFAGHEMSLGDPVAVSLGGDDYFGLASKFEHIVTDRLHFAIAGMIIGRRVTLLPNSYGKNRGMYETWLRDLGCRWRSAPDGIRTDHDGIRRALWKRISAPPSVLAPWGDAIDRDPSWRAVEHGDGIELESENGDKVVLDGIGAAIYSLCDGSWTPEAICDAFSTHYDQPIDAVAREVQRVLRTLARHRAVAFGGAADAPEPAPRAPVTRNRIIDVDIGRIRREGGRLTWSARVSGTSRGDDVVYFSVDARWRGALTPRADPFVLSVLPRAMVDGADLKVSGAPVDAALLDRLDEYQRAWQAWRPEKVAPVSIRATEVDAPRHRGRPALAAFSGGVDSLYTLFRHRVEPDGRRNRDLGAVVMANGFDIPIHDRAGYRRAIDRLRPLTDEAGVELIEVETNARLFTPRWEMEHGASLAAVLCLFSRQFGAGLIPSTAPYQFLFPWGTNPVTDHLLGGNFEIDHDSAAVMRGEKIGALARWPAALQRLRVCWQNRHVESNCGHCIKCYHLAMGLQAFGAPLACFETSPDPGELAAYAEKARMTGLEGLDFSYILGAATSRGVRFPWVDVVEARVATPATPATP